MTSTPSAKKTGDVHGGQGGQGRHGHHGPTGGTPALALGALGIVFGDIGTSPLYALRETFEGHGHELRVNEANVYGVLSLITWSLIIVISIKYLAFVMKADNEGEGGILALTALLRRDGTTFTGRRKALLLLGLFGTALLYGDAAITPAISVLSAVEGVTVQAPDLEPAVLPIAVAILVGIFVFQRRGTTAIGKVFGPVMVVWFSVMSVLGLMQIVKEPGIFRAVNPWYAVQYFHENAFHGFLALGSMFLVVTGGEALYADMGHFGRKPIQMAWFVLVLPALLISYYGQGVLLLREPDAIENPLFRLAPEWAPLPDGGAGDVRHDHRLAGPHIGRVLADDAGDPAGLRPASPDPPHLRVRLRPGLHPGHQLGPDDRLHRPGDRVRQLDPPGRRLRAGGHLDDGDHRHPLLLRAARAVPLGGAGGDGAVRRLPGRRSRPSSGRTCSRSRRVAGSRSWSRWACSA